MTDIYELNTYSVNAFVTAKDGGRQVLLVGIKEAYREKPQYQKVLKREFAKNHELDHPNVIKYLAEKDVEGLGPCIEMEWEDSRTLTDYLQEGHSADEKKNVMEQIAEGVSYLHQHGVIHGALEPSIIFITKKDDQVKILNFRQRYADGLNQPASSLKYIAPEAKDGTVALDARADIFSLGQILRSMDIASDYRPIAEQACSFGRSDRYMDVDAFLAAFSHRRHAHAGLSEEIEDSDGHSSSRVIYVLVGVIAVLVVIAAIWVFNQQSNQDNATATDNTEQVDSANQAQQQQVEAAQPDSTPSASQAQQPAEQGDMAFLNDLVPQMKIDLDKIYAQATDQATIGKKVGTYYKGLRRVLIKQGLNDTQLQAFDKAFADYNNQKKAE